MTAAYWLIGRHIVAFEQSGEERAAYGTALVERLATDMTQRFGRGFSPQNLWQMRQFCLSYPLNEFSRRCLENRRSPPQDLRFSRRCLENSRTTSTKMERYKDSHASIIKPALRDGK